MKNKTTNTSKITEGDAVIRICGQQWRLKYRLPQEMAELGLCNADTREISLNLISPPDIMKNTLLHELLHALSYVGNLDMCERQVDVLATLLIALARDNPGLLENLFTESADEFKS